MRPSNKCDEWSISQRIYFARYCSLSALKIRHRHPGGVAAPHIARFRTFPNDRIKLIALRAPNRTTKKAKFYSVSIKVFKNFSIGDVTA